MVPARVPTEKVCVRWHAEQPQGHAEAGDCVMVGFAPVGLTRSGSVRQSCKTPQREPGSRHGTVRRVIIRSTAACPRAEGETQARISPNQSLCIFGVGVDTRRVPVPKSASTATVPETETIRPRPWRSWQTRSPTQNTSSGGIASRAALKGLAGRRRRCTGGGMYPSSSF
jgi:hypothetical protein